MKNFKYLFYIFLLCYKVLTTDYFEMSHKMIIQESQNCSESNFSKDNCLQKSSCFYLEWEIDLLKEIVSLCLSYNETMKYYVKDPKEFLLGKGIKNHKDITRNNFCDIIDDTHEFLNIVGEIKLCELGSE